MHPSPPIDIAPRRLGTDISADDAALAAHFRPIFARIAAGAVARETNRALAHDAVAWLREASFGRVRIPRAHGGMGATIPQFFGLLAELATADSNVSHAWHGHFAFLEERLNQTDEPAIDFWFPKVAAGAMIGYAMAERTEETGSSTLLTRDGEAWRLDGVKRYRTGTIYADWIVAAAKEGEDFVSLAVRTDALGVTCIDDWDGFGQRLTGSGVNNGVGYFRNGIKYTFDDLPITTPSGTPYELFEPQGLQYTQILRGDDAFLTGPLALGGTINYATNTGRTAPYSEIRAEAGSFGHFKGALATGNTVGNWDYYLLFTGVRQDGWQQHLSRRRQLAYQALRSGVRLRQFQHP